ncbi:thioredoxin family protein [Pontixanthobacter gangjinensis]
MGCTENSPEATSVFIGGQINNPETDYVIISKENETIDTLYLDEKNQFGKDFKNLEGGIYTFKHPPESQIMYMEPGDSIVIWLNTLSFDESLNFSGEGAQKSNFLLDMFLKNRSNNDLILTYYKIEPEEFARITDSIKNSRLKELEELKEKHEFSDEFLKVARSSIDYEYYDLRERYNFLIRKYYNDYAEKIPENFNDYRKEIDFNNEALQDYYVYTNLIDDYLRSKSIETCIEEHADHQKCFNINTYKNIERRILLIDSLSEIESLKNEFLDRLSAQAITMAEGESRLDSILGLLESINYSHINTAEELAEIQKNYFVGQSINDLTAQDTEGNIIKYGDVIDSPTITFAWSIYSPAHHRWQHSIIKELEEKYPELNFLGVNIDLGDREEWLRTLETFDYNKENEYQIVRRSTSKETYRKYLNKIFFVNSDGTIVKGDINLGGPDFESKLQEFINK